MIGLHSPAQSRCAGLRKRVGSSANRGRQIRRKRTLHDELAALGMRDPQKSAVQRESMQSEPIAKQSIVLAFAVANIADQRTRDVLEVPPHLMQAAGVRTRCDDGIAPQKLRAPDFGDRVDARFARLRWNRVIDHGVLGRMTARDRDVHLDRSGRSPRVRKHASRIAVERKQCCARSAAIEAMNRINVRTNGIANALQQRIAAAIPTAMSGNPRRFVHDHAATIAM